MERAGLRWAIDGATTLGVVLGGTPAAALAERNAWAVACGPMFASGRPRFLLRDPHGVRVESREPTRGATVLVMSGGQAMAQDGASTGGVLAIRLGDAPVAVQGYPSLVRGGRVQPVQESARERRVALAILEPSRVALVAGVGTMEAFARALAEGGAREAIYLDGGRAAHLATVTDVAFRHAASETPVSWITIGGHG